MWVSVTLEAAAAHAEALSEALLAAGAISVSVEDAQAGTALETPQFGEPGASGTLATPLWDVSRVVALFDPPASLGDLRDTIAVAVRAAGIAQLPEINFSEVAEQDWVRLTQSQFEPIRISDRLWIVPSWHSAPDPTAINLELDPGLAFGTGSHPTTRLCLEWLEREVQPGITLLDYGCGSGILGIAALKLGAADVLGVDIDASALTAAADNAACNRVVMRLAHSGDALTATYDRVVANILTNPLMLLAPLLAARLKPGGKLALSGVLETQAGQVIAAYAPYLPLTVGATHDGWVRLEGEN
ncbi:MAG: 50S ribosomal protein L11 methyltransferase [Gammaproteobacteria bacterium]|nr:50S ribosomal protein L11 methyltransferase [Rhodocyclaceae bacterium]MBU3908181.1 50S ribosomal protein L11 methyltransferase [Gammaproteobacteria bacterium]MBU3989117.1 50S ribosomal protein L11 methyltransferase [Gammaproteobacteria bacterium]MBU4005994.1 50S ribosomal protein L11 methyltransferase [Gammaproteobacteria bacterium]MBU4020000.1 50S ribosomal protein L11 methyltransferase [Gammaproteobacteria bacterium]